MRKQYKGYGRYIAISNMKDIDRNPHRLDEVPKNNPSRYITTHCSADVGWLQESTSFGGHSIPKGGHRRVSGLVRANVKEEVRKEIETELNEEGVISQQEIANNDWLTIDEAKEETMNAIRSEYGKEEK